MSPYTARRRPLRARVAWSKQAGGRGREGASSMPLSSSLLPPGCHHHYLHAIAIDIHTGDKLRTTGKLCSRAAAWRGLGWEAERQREAPHRSGHLHHRRAACHQGTSRPCRHRRDLRTPARGGDPPLATSTAPKLRRARPPPWCPCATVALASDAPSENFVLANSGQV